jgi:plasmid stability protein
VKQVTLTFSLLWLILVIILSPKITEFLLDKRVGRLHPKRNREENMVTITVKNIPKEIYERIKVRAVANHRSINGEILSILEQAVSLPPIDVEATLERARKVRELTAKYTVTAEEIEKMINEGRE